MELREPALIDEIERAGKHVFALGRETSDNVRAEGNIGPQPPCLLAERDCVTSRMPPLHALENKVVAGLQR